MKTPIRHSCGRILDENGFCWECHNGGQGVCGNCHKRTCICNGSMKQNKKEQIKKVVYKDNIGNFYIRSEDNVSIRIDENAYNRVINLLAQSRKEVVEEERKRVLKVLQSVEDIAEDETKHHFAEHCSCLRYGIWRAINPDASEMLYASKLKSLSSKEL